jgi:hypothetical protein
VSEFGGKGSAGKQSRVPRGITAEIAESAENSVSSGFPQFRHSAFGSGTPQTRLVSLST